MHIFSKNLYLDSTVQASYLSILHNAEIKGILKVGNTISLNGSIVPEQGELSRDEITGSKEALVFGLTNEDANKFSDIKFGFGTRQPLVNFHIKGRSYIAPPDLNHQVSTIKSTGNPNIIGTTLRIEDEVYGSAMPIGPQRGTWWDFTASDENGKLFIGTKAYDPSNNPYTNNLIAITIKGNVGIGTMNPQKKLHVNGDILLSGQSPSLLFSKSENSPSSNYGIKYLSTNQIGNNKAGLNFFIPATNPNNSQNFLLHISDDGNVGIGTGNPGARLDINYAPDGDYSYATKIYLSGEFTENCKSIAILQNGLEKFVVWGNGIVNVNNTLYAKAVKVRSNPMIGWPDNVFEPNYNLLPLKELEQYISQNKHLPNIPTQDEISKDGMDVYEMNAALLKKVEELTLYVIELEKRIDKIEKDK
ncbi:MAG TPA: hypothetical protein PK081_03220 [Bacteroidales bacterium]|nr:hypothetical protein [Bacteroidales bacterium]